MVHPKSCRVCCPFDPDAEEPFDPFSAPYLDELFVRDDARGVRGNGVTHSGEV